MLLERSEGLYHKFAVAMCCRLILTRQFGTFYLLCILLAVSVFWYVISPRYNDFDKIIFYINLGIFIISTITYFRSSKKMNYLDFDTIFVCVYFVVGYIATFYYNTDIYPYLFLHFPFDERYINSSLWLFTIGILSYYIGRLVLCSGRNEGQRPIGFVVNTNLSSFLLILLFIVYLYLGGVNRYIDIYLRGENTGGMVIQIEILVTALSYVIIATELYNKKLLSSYKIKKMPIIIISIITILLLYAGNRTLPSYFILSGLGLYALLFKPINLKKMLALMFLGIVGMWAIGLNRSGYNITPQQNAAMYVVDMTINTRNTYVAMEYVDQYGFTYGKTMLYGILGVAPFLSSILGVDKNEIGSAEVLTQYTYDNMSVDRDYIGLGTNVIADIYLSFGMLGVIILMFIVGILINRCTKSAMQMNYYAIIAYAIIVSMSVFGIRTGLTHVCRMLIWSLTIAYFNKNYTMYLCSRK